ncbi:MAG: TIGR04255 family protein, partial [Mycobacteriaceae bacterium]|nr:TIGR04255 family protein [Mycobacteriaceae bacterium]
MNDTEVYRNAPIALATIEIRHPTTDPLTSSESRELKRLLAETLPIERPGQDSAWAIVPPATTPTQTGERFARHLNRDGTTSATIKTQATIIESTAYPGFEAFCELMLQVAEARNQVSSIVGVERV